MAKSSNKPSRGNPPVNQAPAVQPANVPEGFRVKRQITLPSLAIKAQNESHILRFDSAMRISDVMDKPKGDAKPRDPATIANVTEVSTGEQFIFIVPTVVKKNLERDYKDNGYVGCVFQITNKGKRKESQRYNDFAIAELEAA